MDFTEIIIPLALMASSIAHEAEAPLWVGE